MFLDQSYFILEFFYWIVFIYKYFFKKIEESTYINYYINKWIIF